MHRLRDSPPRCARKRAARLTHSTPARPSSRRQSGETQMASHQFTEPREDSFIAHLIAEYGPNPLPVLTERQIRNFHAKVERKEGCWLWIGAKHNSYGRVVLNGKDYRAHRVAYMLHNGSDPASGLVCHTCDNPPCVNPAHLFLGTHSENTRDMFAKGRHPGGSGQNFRDKAKLTEAGVRFIRQSAESHAQLARHFGVDPDTIWKARVGRSWSNVI